MWIRLTVIVIMVLSLTAAGYAQESQSGQRAELEAISEIIRLTSGIRYLEESQHPLTNQQATMLLPLFADVVEAGMAYRARVLRTEVLELLGEYVSADEGSPIHTELQRRRDGSTGDGGPPVAMEEEARGTQSGGANRRVDHQSDSDDRTHVIQGIREQIEQLLGDEQHRYIDSLPLPATTVRQAREAGNEVVLLFEELVEWFLAEKVAAP